MSVNVQYRCIASWLCSIHRWLYSWVQMAQTEGLLYPVMVNVGETRERFLKGGIPPEARLCSPCSAPAYCEAQLPAQAAQRDFLTPL